MALGQHRGGPRGPGDRGGCGGGRGVHHYPLQRQQAGDVYLRRGDARDERGSVSPPRGVLPHQRPRGLGLRPRQNRPRRALQLRRHLRRRQRAAFAARGDLLQGASSQGCFQGPRVVLQPPAHPVRVPRHPGVARARAPHQRPHLRRRRVRARDARAGVRGGGLARSVNAGGGGVHTRRVRGWLHGRRQNCNAVHRRIRAGQGHT
mmetsp:Transcript_34702/g.66284  ORF Transcript_34702/g.66284 Transcript_34702/m.66284 type:complete len:205 (-) Transcript_34702:789-1403(-)